MRMPWLLAGLAVLFLHPLIPADGPVKQKDKDVGKSFQVPFRLSDSGHIVVRAKINGKGPFNFIVDTGAPLVYFSKEAAEKIGIKAEKKGLNDLDKIEIEGGPTQVKFKCLIDTPPQLEGMNAMGFAGVELHGMFGYSLLAHYRMEIDFTKDRMTWTRLDFTPPAPQPIGSKDDKPGELDTMSKLIKSMVGLLGVKGPREPLLRGFFGLQLAEKDKMVVVQSVLTKGPAATAGLRAGDRIMKVQGEDVATLAEALRDLAKATPGQMVLIIVQRQGEEKQITITAGEGL